jgi:hypothetical protein
MTGDEQGLSDSSINPRCCMSWSISPTSASFAICCLLGGWRIGQASPVSIRWYTLSVNLLSSLSIARISPCSVNSSNSVDPASPAWPVDEMDTFVSFWSRRVAFRIRFYQAIFHSEGLYNWVINIRSHCAGITWSLATTGLEGRGSATGLHRDISSSAECSIWRPNLTDA